MDILSTVVLLIVVTAFAYMAYDADQHKLAIIRSLDGQG